MKRIASFGVDTFSSTNCTQTIIMGAGGHQRHVYLLDEDTWSSPWATAANPPWVLTHMMALVTFGVDESNEILLRCGLTELTVGSIHMNQAYAGRADASGVLLERFWEKALKNRIVIVGGDFNKSGYQPQPNQNRAKIALDAVITRTTGLRVTYHMVTNHGLHALDGKCLVFVLN